MKKPTFIITQTVLSLFLAASVAAVGVLVYDLKTDSIHLDKVNPLELIGIGTNDTSKKNSEQSKKKQNSSSENSQKSQSETSKQESSQEESSRIETLQFVSEPQNLTEQPKELTDMLKRYGYKIENNVSGDRLIVVDTNKSSASIYCYQKSDTGYWWNVMGSGKTLTDNAYIGEKGSSFVITEGSNKTPGGIFSMGDAFYIDDKPNTEYPMFQITDDTYWVTDPKSKFFNQKVEGTDEMDWNTADHMITKSKQYKYGMVIKYNTDNIKTDAGSEILLHCGDSPTAGCVAVPENIMKTIIEWLDKDSRVTIFITV